MSMKTEFGTAEVYKDYYKIISRKEGNHGKYLHRLIWEKANGNIPDGYVIHHKDGNRLNNDLSNLELMELHEHQRLSWLGKKKSVEHIKKHAIAISKPEPHISKDGFTSNGKQRYCLKINGKRVITSINKEKLEKELRKHKKE